jgi:hypothetical protein
VKAKAMQHTDQLIEKAAFLSRAAPTQWREFLNALSVYSDKQMEILVNSPVPDLQVLQGRAQALKTLLTTLTNAVETADKIAGKAKK